MKKRTKIAAILLSATLSVSSMGLIACDNAKGITEEERATNFVNSVTEVKQNEGYNCYFEGNVNINDCQLLIPQKYELGNSLSDATIAVKMEAFVGMDAQGMLDVRGAMKADIAQTAVINQGEEKQSVMAGALTAAAMLKGDYVYYAYEYDVKYPQAPDAAEKQSVKDKIALVELLGMLQDEPVLPEQYDDETYYELYDDLLGGGDSYLPTLPYEESLPEMSPIMAEIMPLIGEFVETEVLPAMKKAAEESAQNTAKTLKAIKNVCFEEKTVGNNKEIILSAAKIKQFNADLATLKISELVDKYIGEGTYAQMRADIVGALDVTVGDVIEKLEEKGITISDITALMDKIAEQVMGEGATAEDLVGLPKGLTIEGMITDEIKALGVIDVVMMLSGSGETLMPLMTTEQIKSMLGAQIDALGETTVYKAMGVTNSAEIKANVDKALDEMAKIVECKLVVDKNNSTFKSVEMKFSLTKEDLAKMDSLSMPEAKEVKIVFSGSITKGGFANKVAADYDALTTI